MSDINEEKEKLYNMKLIEKYEYLLPKVFLENPSEHRLLGQVIDVLKLHDTGEWDETEVKREFDDMFPKDTEWHNA